MDPSDSHQPFGFTTLISTYVPEGVTAQNISPLTSLTLDQLNCVEPQVQPQVESELQPQDVPEVQQQVEPHVETHVAVQVEPHATSEVALVTAEPSSNRRPYPDMIYDAIVALKEHEGSSKLAISRYIQRSNPNLPDDHEGLMTHHLKVMKNCGILAMIRKSYKLADEPQVAAATVDAGLVEASRSEIPPTYSSSLDMLAVTASGSASQPQKRGRGRPPKPKTKAPQQHQQPIDAQPISQALQPSINVETNAVQRSGEQPKLLVTNPAPVVTRKRGPGRPRKNDGSGPSVPSQSLAVMMKRRGWPMSIRTSGRERNPMSVSHVASVIPEDADGGVERPERPMRSGSGDVATIAPAGVEAMAVAAVMKHGPGRPPKRGRGRTPGRPMQDTPQPVMRATGTTQESDYRELKKKLDLANEKVKEILNVLDAGIATGDNKTIAQAAQEVEGLIQVLVVEPQAMEEVQQGKAVPQIEAETQGMELGQGSKEEGEEALILTQPQPQTLPHLQTETQTMPLPQNMTLTQPQPQTPLDSQPQTKPLPQTLTLTQPQPQFRPELQSQAMHELQTLTLIQPQCRTLSELQPQTMPMSPTLTSTQSRPQFMSELQPQTMHELQPLPQTLTLNQIQPQPQLHPQTMHVLQPVPETLTLTQPQPHILSQIQPNIEAEEMDEDVFRYLK